MSTQKREEIISEASPHTIKKFDLIEAYVTSWAPKLLNNIKCNNLVFIDCMCNSGEYVNEKKGKVFGTPVRVARVLADFAKKYPNKNIYAYFNDYSKDKIDHLAQFVKFDIPNFHVQLSVKDGNDLLKELAPKIIKNKSTCYLLVYDPYEATIDWSAILPYINNWGEVIINHMISDSMRAVKAAKSEQAVKKYESTYLTDIENLIPYGSDKNAYEKHIEEIISKLNSKPNYYVASFPFFNRRNAIVYNLIHCTNSKIGFRLYKQVAWKVFGGKSSTLDTHGQEMQLVLDFENGGQVRTPTFDDCYFIKDIAEYLQNKFAGKQNIPFAEIWALLDDHPVFPSDGFRNDIKQALRSNYNADIKKNTISFESKK
ncbi:MAG: three-Cys-motif partner protein TcmP [Candidatus Coproplasma sp.]